MAYKKKQIKKKRSYELPLWIRKELKKDQDLGEHISEVLGDNVNVFGDEIQLNDVLNSVAYYYYNKSKLK